jgi:hypothetical protein
VVTVIRVTLSDDERRKLAESIGEKGLISREALDNLVHRCIQRRLNGDAQAEKAQAQRLYIDKVRIDRLIHQLNTLPKEIAPAMKASSGPALSGLQTLLASTLPNALKVLKEIQSNG